MGRMGPLCTAAETGGVEPPGAVGFSSDTQPGSCLHRSGPRQAWKCAGRFGFVTALLGTRGVRRRAGGNLLLPVPETPFQSGRLCCSRNAWVHPEDAASLDLGRARLWMHVPALLCLVPGILGPCRCSCPPACFLGLATQPQPFLQLGV